MSNSPQDPDLTRRRATASVLAVIALLAVVAFTWWIDGRDSPDGAAPAAVSSSAAASPVAPIGPRTSAPRTSAPRPSAPRTTAVPETGRNIPARVTKTLGQIDSGRWPEAANAPGTRGGDTFRNNERRLPITDSSGRRIAYKEWDVNAKKAGRGRDAERIVTGSDGSAWYTLDHYQTFTLIRGPTA
ncbi:ribonuclease domain-containing protein [Gordonia aichiensis]|uniref:ribonuclease domain-containing protein n=1 Tax=Gordonia aichiensis TaxID=36820 RepID=UPI0032658305